MPWVRLDDRFPSHRKVALLSDRAFRLYVSALCWCSENLTEGVIAERELPFVARLRGVKKAATELEAAGLWDRAEDGWRVHDYLEYNPDRARVKADRESNAARQKAWRDRKRAEREAKKAAEEADRNGVTRNGREAQSDASATRRRHDGDTTEKRSGTANQQEPQVNAIRNGVSNGAPSRPVPLLSPTEKEEEEGQLASAPAEPPTRIGDRPRIPPNCQPLVEALQAARLFVGWDLKPAEWFLVEALIQRCGIPALVVSATGSWQGARTQPRSATYFLPAWRVLPDAVTRPEPVELPTAVGAEVVPFGPPAHGTTSRPATSDLRVQQALEAGRRLQALADAQNQEQQ
jgi:hypothetical protein